MRLISTLILIFGSAKEGLIYSKVPEHLCEGISAASFEMSTLRTQLRFDPKVYLRRNRIWNALASIVLVIFFIHIFISREREASVSSLAEYILIMLCIAGLFGASLHMAGYWRDKADLSVKVNRLYDAFESKEPFVLWLRSFQSGLVAENTYDVRQIEREVVRMVRDVPVPTGRTYTDYERVNPHVDDVREFLHGALNEIRIVAIDGNVQNLTLDMLYVISFDSNWKDIFRELSSCATGILIVPEPSTSLTEEIDDLLQQGFMEKCIFLMPPSDSRSGATRAASWPAESSVLPISLPSYSNNGALLKFCADGALMTSLPYTVDAISTALSNVHRSGSTLGVALSKLERSGCLDDVFSHFERELSDASHPRDSESRA